MEASLAEFHAAAMILRAPALKPRTAEAINDQHGRIDFTTLVERSRTWSTPERLLLDAALDVWSGGGDASLGQLIRRLDAENFAVLLRAIAVRKRVQVR